MDWGKATVNQGYGMGRQAAWHAVAQAEMPAVVEGLEACLPGPVLTRKLTLEAEWSLEPTPPCPNMGRLLWDRVLQTLCNLPNTVGWEMVESEKSPELRVRQLRDEIPAILVSSPTGPSFRYLYSENDKSSITAPW